MLIFLMEKCKIYPPPKKKKKRRKKRSILDEFFFLFSFMTIFICKKK